MCGYGEDDPQETGIRQIQAHCRVSCEQQVQVQVRRAGGGGGGGGGRCVESEEARKHFIHWAEVAVRPLRCSIDV